MSRDAAAFWDRAVKTYSLAKRITCEEPDSSASRAYYAAFYAVSALFAMKGRTFTKHSAVENAVHKELIKPGAWPNEAGKAYSLLLELRITGDYGGISRVSEEGAKEAVNAAWMIIEIVHSENPKMFPLEKSEPG